MSESFNERRSRWWRRIAVGVVLVIVAAVAGAWWLIDPMSTDNDADRISGIQAVFTIGFGLGGLATLALFARRQWLQELEHEHALQVAADARHDAEQRRITEQFVKAIEQLGHEKAPVRLGGLYALDRLGREHPGQRREIIEIWSAYLRRRVPLDPDLLRAVYDSPAHPEIPLEATATVGEAFDEYEVRTTAQRLLISHLQDPRPPESRDDKPPPESDEYWRTGEINLAGALLSYADFSDCWLPLFFATRATFMGNTHFDNTRFGSTGVFASARFLGSVGFFRAAFGGNARFDAARFEGAAMFAEAEFKLHAYFEQAQLGGETAFRKAHFKGHAGFGGLKRAPESSLDMTDAITDVGENPMQQLRLPSDWVPRQRGDSWRLVRRRAAAAERASRCEPSDGAELSGSTEKGHAEGEEDASN